jgi:hypothetical protein
MGRRVRPGAACAPGAPGHRSLLGSSKLEFSQVIDFSQNSRQICSWHKDEARSMWRASGLRTDLFRSARHSVKM